MQALEVSVASCAIITYYLTTFARVGMFNPHSSRYRARMAEKSRKPVVEQAAQRLRALSVELDDGEFLGREEALCQQLAVSRETLRQAATMLVQEQTLTVRRGKSGGFYARRPTISAVANVAAVFLRVHGTSPAEIIDAVEANRIGLARLASRCRRPEAVKAMVAFLESERRICEEGSDAEVLADWPHPDRRFTSLLVDMTDNRVMGLVAEILSDFASALNSEKHIWPCSADAVREYRSWRNRLIEAILGGDEEMVSLMARKCSEFSTRLMLQSVGSDATTDTVNGLSNYRAAHG